MPDVPKPERVDLRVEDPTPLRLGHFGLCLPTDLSEESFETVKQHIEFRRKCMNQGFDNLLELLEMNRKIILKAAERQEADASEAGHA